MELADERLAKGPGERLPFRLRPQDGQVCGYTCYGPIALTIGSYDLYWIAVAKSAAGPRSGPRAAGEDGRVDSGVGRASGVHRDLDPAALITHPRLLRAMRLSPRSRAQGLLRLRRRQGDLRQGNLTRIIHHVPRLCQPC